MKKINSAVFLFFQLLAIGAAYSQGPGPGNDQGEFQPLGDAPVPAENPVTEAKRVLGKILFWDEQLSSDNTVACGTCHQPAAGGSDLRLGRHPGFDQIFGTDDDVIGSPGIKRLDSLGRPVVHPQFGLEAQVTNRASPSFFTSLFAESNFWDGRATDQFVDPLDSGSVLIVSGGALESQAIVPILSTVEMAREGRTWADVVGKLDQVQPLALASDLPADVVDALAGDRRYGDLFEEAFGDSEITPARIGLAIASYERTLVPNETPWDLYVAGNDTAMTASQIAGWESFIDTPCANCHEPPRFSNDDFHNIGLRPSAEDLGRFDVTGRNNQRGDFKTPSLRNVGLRRALMHVGWVTDVEDALDFYNAGTSNTRHRQFLDDQDGIPGNPLDINALAIFPEDDTARAQFLDFLRNGLTDPRVANESYPFDRPTLASETGAAANPAAIAGINSASAATAASFRISVLDDKGRGGNAFNSADTLTIAANILVDPSDVGSFARLFCVVIYNDAAFARNEAGTFMPWNGNEATLPALGARELNAVEVIAIAEGISNIPGQFEIYVAYENQSQQLVYSGAPASFSVLP